MDLIGNIFNIQHYSTSDGPGIRTTIFLKGCNLKCIWCSNPESLNEGVELFFLESMCTNCGKCIAVCPAKANFYDEHNKMCIDRDLCTGCGKCAVVCMPGARCVSGKNYTIDEVMEIIKKETLFYRNSGGGITASGGEATRQSAFLKELFKRCHALGIHTALETSGQTKWSNLESLLEHLDLFLFDLKHMDTKEHKKLTGSGNKLIKANLEALTKRKAELIIRMPLIDGLTDTDENVSNTASYIYGLGYRYIELIPYHRLGVGKYDQLDVKFKLENLPTYDTAKLEDRAAIFEKSGIKVKVI